MTINDQLADKLESELNPRIEKEIIDRALELAKRIYSYMGYEVDKGYKFYQSSHSQEQMVWQIVVTAYDFIEGTDIDDTLVELWVQELQR